MNLPLLNKTAAILITSLLSIVAITPQVTAAPKNPKVTSVELDLDAGKMIITGRYLGGKKFRGDVMLHLAETGPITLKVDRYKKLQPTEEVPILLQQLRVSGLPQNIAEFTGVHLLEVRRKYTEKVDGVSVVKYKIGTSTVTIGAVGPAGADGQDGEGVASANINAEGNLIVTLTNGSEINAGQVGVSNAYLQISGSLALFDFTGGSGSLDVQSNTDWEWEIDGQIDGWLTSPDDGSLQNGDKTFTYEVAPLEGNAPREANIIFQSTNGPRYEWYFTVRQQPQL